MSRDHEQYQENVGAYLLGALTELEVEVFERHLATCASCRHDFDELRVAADALPRTVEPVSPPATLKESLMRTVWEEAAAREEPVRRKRWRRPGYLSRLLDLRPAMAAAAAAAVLAIGVAVGWGVSQIGGGGGKQTLAASVDRARVPEATASLEVPKDRAKGAVLRVQGLPQPGPGRVYEVWVQRRGVMAPAGSLFDVGSAGTGSAAIPGNLRGAQAVAVTRERQGGSPRPTEAPLLTFKLS
jgi:anti-sigma-K factor RskA